MIKSGTDVARWVCKELHACYEEGAQGIGLMRDGKLIAGVCYENWNSRSIVTHIVIMGRITRDYLFAIFHYPFEYLGVDKIICPIAESNDESMRFVANLGFEREATIADAHPSGAIYIYSMKREKCRFLGERYGQRLTVATASA